MLHWSSVALVVITIAFFFQHFVNGSSSIEEVPASIYTAILAKNIAELVKAGVEKPQKKPGCGQLTLGEDADLSDINIPDMTWILTPSIVNIEPGYYRVLGRVVHMEYLIEQLKTEGLVVDATETETPVNNTLQILADTLYIKGKFRLRAIKNIRVFAREIVASQGSQLDLSAPSRKHEFKTDVSAGGNGEDGKDGFDGNTVEVYADVIRGTLQVIANGGDGTKGQDGGEGENGKATPPNPDVPASACSKQKTKGPFTSKCKDFPGKEGIKGADGKPGGNAGKPGNGGMSGYIVLFVNTVLGKVKLDACPGRGAPPAKNGPGGSEGKGGRGSRGRDCRVLSDIFTSTVCETKKQLPKKPDGPPGTAGPPGTTPNTPGKKGKLPDFPVIHGKVAALWLFKVMFPMELLHVIKRRAEDLLLGKSDDASGRAALEFIVKAPIGKDAFKIRKGAKRMLGFLGKRGYDIFGNCNLFSPRLTWKFFTCSARKIKEDATTYEEAFNTIKAEIDSKKAFAELGSKIARIGALQVGQVKTRLEEARRVAVTEKDAYVRGIQQLENQMEEILKRVKEILPKVHKKAKFNADDVLVVLQGLTGFAKAVVTADPLELLDSALGVAGGLKDKDCLQSLKKYLGSVKQWLTFGKHYTPLEDSSDLDFEKIDVSSIPDMMEANLEKNREALTADLICLLDIASRPKDTAELKQHIESFFITGSARIDLIARILDLDNEIGGINYDIPVLEETMLSINEIGKPADTPIKKRLKLLFLDNLLSVYKESERSFMMTVYDLFRAFRFRTLWEGKNPLTVFRRVATESAHSTGRLNGILQLTDVLKEVDDAQRKATKCFTNNHFVTDFKRWSFDNVQDKPIYIELTGDKAQPDNVPSKVYLKVRHLSRSYFRAGDQTVKEYHQPLGSFQSIKFDRFRITDKEKCKSGKITGNESPRYCMTETDSRWTAMCKMSEHHCGADLLGVEECKSPFGLYELRIPVDKNLPCDDSVITDKNCKDLDLTRFTKMNVWTFFFFWSEGYPKGPDDPLCKVAPLKKQDRNPESSNYTFDYTV